MTAFHFTVMILVLMWFLSEFFRCYCSLTLRVQGSDNNPFDTLLERRFLFASSIGIGFLVMLVIPDEWIVWSLILILPMLMASLCSWRESFEDFYVYLRG